MLLGIPFIGIAEETWSVGEVVAQGKPVVYKFMSNQPELEIRNNFPWLTVVSWKYDGSKTNGMPNTEVNTAMIRLENGLDSIKGNGGLYRNVYSVTGNDIKEFAFYITDREKFMANFNDALSEHPAYPIQVSFYDDKVWADLSKLQKMFKNAANKAN